MVLGVFTGFAKYNLQLFLGGKIQLTTWQTILPLISKDNFFRSPKLTNYFEVRYTTFYIYVCGVTMHHILILSQDCYISANPYLTKLIIKREGDPNCICGAF